MKPLGRVLARPVVGAAIVVSAAFAAGCSGSPSVPAPQGAAQFQSRLAMRSSVVEPDACKTKGGVRADPCLVKLDASNPGPVTVTLKTPHGSKGSVVEHDNCGGASGIASISGSGQSWSVTAGSQAGACHAHFNYFNNNQRVGWVRITIKNSV